MQTKRLIWAITKVEETCFVLTSLKERSICIIFSIFLFSCSLRKEESFSLATIFACHFSQFGSLKPSSHGKRVPLFISFTRPLRRISKHRFQPFFSPLNFFFIFQMTFSWLILDNEKRAKFIHFASPIEAF